MNKRTLATAITALAVSLAVALHGPLVSPTQGAGVPPSLDHARAAGVILVQHTCATMAFSIGLPAGWYYDGPTKYDQSFSDGCSAKDGIGYLSPNKSAQFTLTEGDGILSTTPSDDVSSWVDTLAGQDANPTYQTVTIHGLHWTLTSLVSHGKFGDNLVPCLCYDLIASAMMNGYPWDFEAQVRRDRSDYQAQVHIVNRILQSVVLRHLVNNGHLLDITNSGNMQSDTFSVSGPFTITWDTTYQDPSIGAGLFSIELDDANGNFLDLPANTTQADYHWQYEQQDCSSGCTLSITADNISYHVMVDKGDPYS